MKPDAQILIVDGEPAAIQLLRKTLSGMGVLRFATSGQEALAEKVRAAVLYLATPHARSSASDWVSVSIGVASLVPGVGRGWSDGRDGRRW